MSVADQNDSERLLAEAQAIGTSMWAEFERITAHINEADPHQVALIQPELDRVLHDGRAKLTKLITDEIFRALIIKPLTEMLGLPTGRNAATPPSP
jgi:hypothetical protein